MTNYTAMPSLTDLHATYAIDAASPSGLSRIKASRGRNGMHVIDNSMGPVELAVELHAVVAIAANTYDWPCSTITTTARLNPGQA